MRRLACDLGGLRLPGRATKYVAMASKEGVLRLANREDTPHSGLSDGFSLLEMMAVVVLILILATFAMPYYRTIIVRAHEANLRDELFTLRSQIDHFTHDNARGPSSLEELVEKEYMGAVPIDPFTGSSETWQVDPGDASLAIDDSAPAGIVDVHSGSPDSSLEGTPYSSW
jgi:general secretion pathway protein G